MSAPLKSETTTTDEGEQITVRVCAQEHAQPDVFFKVRPRTQMGKLMNTYCERCGVARETVSFLFDGQRIMDDSTPEALNMEDADIIDVVLSMVGGTSMCGGRTHKK